MLGDISRLLNRAQYIIKTDGIIGVVKRGAVYLLPNIFKFESVYLYRHSTGLQLDEANYKPRRQDVEFKVIRTNQEADLLVPNYTDLREIMFDARSILDKGGIAVCLYIGRELAHISWLAVNGEARDSVDEIPYEIKFSEKQACTGKTFTDPKYRGQNLMVYGNYMKLNYLREIGVSSLFHAVGVKNIASQKGYKKFDPTIYAQGRYLKIFNLKFWRQKPLVS
ncbi:MAG TPA: hypothetical protein VF318_04895 [Dehalococcoidales bacterium]